LRVDNKNFYFDIGQNNRGIYMRMSEVSSYQSVIFIVKENLKITKIYTLQVKSNFRTAITVPEKCWTRFRDILNDYCEKMSETATTTADNNTQAAQSSAPTSAGGSQK
jgi:transcriptional activator protein Pur-alpha